MRIAIDAAALARGKDTPEAERSLQFIKGLQGGNTPHQYVLFSLFASREEILHQLGWDAASAMEIHSFFMGPEQLLLRNEAFSGIVEDVVRQFISKERIEAFWLPEAIPEGSPSYRPEWFQGTRTVSFAQAPAFADIHLSWEAVEGALSETKEELLQEAFASLPQRPDDQTQKRMRIAFFSPMPPAQSGIADYSVDILWAIADSLDVDVFTEAGEKASVALPENVRVLSHTRFQAGNYDRVVYQMGNSLYHQYMLPYLQQTPGLVVLHDTNLHAMAAAITLRDGNVEGYGKILAMDYSAFVVSSRLQEIKYNSKPTPYNEMTVNGFVAQYARRILVHSLYAKEQLLRMNIGYDAHHIPLYAKLDPLMQGEEAKARLSIDQDAQVIAAFGHIGYAKRVVPIVKAFARLAPRFPKAQLFFVGKPVDESIQEVEDEIQKSALTDRVTITGFVEMEQFSAYIGAADVCLNLRYPESGESSACLMRLLAQAKCTVINDIGSFSELPDDGCRKLPSVEYMTPPEEMTRIEQALQELLENDALRKDIGRNARKYAQEHLDLSKIGEQYVRHIRSTLHPHLNPALFSSIGEALRQTSHTAEDVRRLSQTLAYSKNPEVEATILQQQITTDGIMRDIRQVIRAEGQYA